MSAQYTKVTIEVDAHNYGWKPWPVPPHQGSVKLVARPGDRWFINPSIGDGYCGADGFEGRPANNKYWQAGSNEGALLVRRDGGEVRPFRKAEQNELEFPVGSLLEFIANDEQRQQEGQSGDAFADNKGIIRVDIYYKP